MNLYYKDNSIVLYHGDCREVLKTLPDCSVHCCVTSPPYWGLRDYGHDGQIGLEQTPEAYVAEMVAVFREVKRVLRDDGTLWLNIGDSYASVGGVAQPHRDSSSGGIGKKGTRGTQAYHAAGGGFNRPSATHNGIKPKDLVGIPWRVAFALQADGWYLRQDIIWHKPNPMPESVQDRCCKAHEYMFLLSKSARYYFDNESIKEPAANEAVQQVPDREAGNVFQQKQSAGGRADRRVQGLPAGDSQGMESRLQRNGKGQSNGGALLLFGEGAGGETGIPGSVHADGRTAGAIPSAGPGTRTGAEVQGATQAIRPECERQGNEGRVGQAVRQNGQGAFCQAQDGDQAQASDQSDGMHADTDGVGRNQGAVQLQVRVLREGCAAGDGSCDASIEGRGTHSSECGSSVPDVQRQERRKNIVGNMSERGVTRTTEGLNLKTAAEKCNGTRTKRSVWTVATKPFSGSHFATFPPALIAPCIMAGTSERGCCPKCGKPWERITERDEPKTRSVKMDTPPGQTKQGGFSKERVDQYPETRTTGWRPGCECNEMGCGSTDDPAYYPYNPIPCTVLDPFNGACTTGYVAKQLGKKYIGIDLNKEYLDLSIKRVAQEVLPLGV